MNKYSHLLEPIKVGNLTLRNRMIASPISMEGFDEQSHYTDESFDFYRLRAAGGCGLVVVGDTLVTSRLGRSHNGHQACLDDETIVKSLSQLAEAIHAGGAAASIEIGHGGMLCAVETLDGRNPIGPSGGRRPDGVMIDEITVEMMDELADAYANAASRVKHCGFDMVMIHGGHGWLLHQFISPISNKRTDEYGGSLKNRMRFPLMVIDRVREAVGRNFPIDIRISGSERLEGGYGIETGIEIAKMLDGKVDMIHVSAGNQCDVYSETLMHPGIFQKQGENASYAREIKKYVKIPVCTVGAFRDPAYMEETLATDGADCIALGRSLIADPFLPKKIMKDEVDSITPCIRCMECMSGLMRNQCLRCTVNPWIGREREFFNPPMVVKKKKVLIAGGGPGGMEAALLAAMNGHQVVLCEASDKLGGALKYADNADFKESLKTYRNSQISRVQKLPIKLRLNTKVDKSVIEEEKPDALVIAIGSDTLIPPIKGIEEGLANGKVLLGADITDNTPLGEKVLIIGGGLIGCETGVHIGSMGHQTEILEMKDEVASDCGRMYKLNLMHQVETCDKLQTFCGYSCTKITTEGVFAKSRDGQEKFFAADTIILAVGMTPKRNETDDLRKLVAEHYVIGDAMYARRVGNAVADAYHAVVNIGLY